MPSPSSLEGDPTFLESPSFGFPAILTESFDLYSGMVRNNETLIDTPISFDMLTSPSTGDAEPARDQFPSPSLNPEQFNNGSKTLTKSSSSRENAHRERSG